MEIGIYASHPNKSINTSAFYGLNRQRRGERGEFEDMENMSSSEYPCAAPRGAREIMAQTEYDIKCVAAPDSTTASSVSGLTGIMNGAFYYNGEKKSGTDTLDMALDWQIIRKGNLYIINGSGESISVMYWYNVDTDDFDMAGVAMTNLIVSPYTSGDNNSLTAMGSARSNLSEYTYLDANGNTVSNSAYYAKYYPYYDNTVNMFSRYFSVGDEVTIMGFPEGATDSGQVWSTSYNSGTGIVTVTAQTSGYDFTKNNTVDPDEYADPDSIPRQAIVKAVISSMPTPTSTVTYGQHVRSSVIYFTLTRADGAAGAFNYETGLWCSGITIMKKKRNFDNIAAHNGRIWGTAPTGNGIFASASDNIFSFSADDITNGYAARLVSDTPGKFTAICEYGSDLLAFKEDSISVVMGNNPLNYSIYTINDIGCIDGRSVAVTPYGVIFLSHSGFCCYGGSQPIKLSDKLDTRYISAVGGYGNDKYYASAKREDGVTELLVCNMKRGMWHIEDDTEAVGFFGFLGEGYLSGRLRPYATTAARSITRR